MLILYKDTTKWGLVLHDEKKMPHYHLYDSNYKPFFYTTHHIINKNRYICILYDRLTI